MLKGEDIICISSIDWDFIWQGHQEIMTRFARGGNRVFFIENTGVRVPTLKDIPRIKSRLKNWRKGIGGIRKIEDNLYVYSPLVLPFPYSRVARLLNKMIILAAITKWLKAMRVKAPIIWTFLPTGLALDIMKEVDHKLLVYYCIDSFVSSSSAARKISHTEHLVIEKADLVFVTSMELRRHCSQYNGNVHNFPFGVNLENFEAVRNDPGTKTPADMPPAKGRVIGYIGGIHKWIDFDLLAFLAEKNPGDAFVLVGPAQADLSKIKDIKNIFILGQKPAAEVPLYIKYFDACLIPYLITDYTKNVYPTKLNEYLSMGKPVVSTPLPEVVEFNKA
ncbi:MAG: glycosyltransferase, partial [Candidatus Omnitrophica bacterium]|nr:glycosyltransferase [Candidatus Omnitrophota bacterium]